MFLLVFSAATASAQQQVPRFQTTVDVTSLVDVTVVDATGQPITGLGRGDFNVKIDGQERRVLSAEWVPVVENARSREGGTSVPEGYSSNENADGGRLIVIAVDQPGINFGGSTAMMKTMEAFIDKLLPSDRVAVVGFGPGTVQLTFLSDFERAKQIIDAPKALSTYGLDKPKLEVTLRQAGKDVLGLKFGSNSKDPEGLYIKTSTKPAVMVVAKDFHDKFNVKVDDLVEAPQPATPTEEKK